MKKIILLLTCFIVLYVNLYAVDEAKSILKELGIIMVQIPNENYEIMSTEVTQKIYKSVMGNNPSRFKGDNHPVESISWYDALEFCNALSEKVGLTPVYEINDNGITQNNSANGFRLPTNSEWTIADEGKPGWYDDLIQEAWCNDNSGGKTHPVAQKEPNDYGLYDMRGNVWEWCWSFYQNRIDYHIIRGGGWKSPSFILGGLTAEYEEKRSSDIGFRIVRNIRYF